MALAIRLISTKHDHMHELFGFLFLKISSSGKKDPSNNNSNK